MLVHPTSFATLQFHFIVLSKILLIYIVNSFFFWYHGLFNYILFNSLWSKETSITFILLHVLRLALWPRMQSILVNAQCALEKIVYSTVTAYSFYKCKLGQVGQLCFKFSVSAYSVSCRCHQNRQQGFWMLLFLPRTAHFCFSLQI